MRQIRSGMFETNSSSMHSITVAEYCADDMMDNSLRPDLNGIIELGGGAFGWTGGAQHSAIIKANYLAVWIKQYAVEANRAKYSKMLVDVIKKQTGARRVEFSFVTGWNNEFLSNHAYIDHQSDDVAAELFDYKYKMAGYDDKYNPIMEKTNMKKAEAMERIRQFIFNPKSVLVLDNDNH